MRVISESATKLETVVLVRPVGHLDSVGADRFWEAVSPQLGGAKTSLLVDMCKVDFMSSAGVGVMVRLFTRVQQLGGVMAVCGCHARVMAVFHVVKLEEILNLCCTEGEAVERMEELGAA